MKRGATSIQKIEPKPKKRKTSGGEFRGENNDAYKTRKGVYILTWHDINKLKNSDFYENPFYKREVTISSDGNVHTMDISKFSLIKFKKFVFENILVGPDKKVMFGGTRGIEIKGDGIKVRSRGIFMLNIRWELEIVFHIM